MSRVAVRSSGRVFCLGLLLAMATIGLPPEAAAQGRHARLSRDLAARIASGDQGVTRVIVEGAGDQLQAIATRYGARVLKVLRRTAVLEVNGGQLDGLEP